MAVFEEALSEIWFLRCGKHIRRKPAILGVHPFGLCARRSPPRGHSAPHQLASAGIKLEIVYSGNPPEIWRVEIRQCRAGGGEKRL